jgi:hypothetical protein
MDCARCHQFVRYLPHNHRHEPCPADAPDYKLKPPPASWQWVGYLRQADGVWRPVALCATLEGCWEAMLTLTAEGDRLAAPTVPVTATERREASR